MFMAVVTICRASLVAQTGKNPAMQETHEMQVQSLAREDPLQVEMPTHSSTLTGPVRHSFGQRSLEAYSPQGCKELDTIELHYINYINTEIHTHTHTHTPSMA